MKFGRWDADMDSGRKIVNCRCECGTERRVATADLRAGKSKSCGCLGREITVTRSRVQNVKHGMDGTATYRAWVDMRRQCTQPHRPDYKNYGARGITVCPRWLDSFEEFLADMGPKPEGYTLDRLNNSQGYSKDNCIWATRKSQERNKRSNRIVEIDGIRMTFAEAVERSGVNYYTAYNRFRVLGWPIDKVFKR